jgi:hypothetical protein
MSRKMTERGRFRELLERSEKAARQRRTATTCETKAVRVLPGVVEAVVATLGVVDRDGDIVDPGALRVSPAGVVVSPWNHSSMWKEQADPPVGFARLAERGNQLVAFVTFDDTPKGREVCKVVSDSRPDWSLGFKVTSTRPVTPSERARGALRAITGWIVSEVSPVDKGAGVSTGTHHACCGTCATAGAKVCDAPPHTDFIPDRWRALPDKVKAVAAKAMREQANERREAVALVGRIREALERIEAGA